MDNAPLVSVISVVYNGEKYLEETIKSIIHQDYKNLEYIVIDGCSSDGTVEIIKKYQDSISYWISEKDKGIYDAMNKGLKAARGEYLNFMNAGDYFCDNKVISDFINDMKKGYLIICADTVIMYPDGFRRRNKLFLNLYIMPAYHQSMFFHRNVFRWYGNYNTKYKFGADIDLWQRVYLKSKDKIIGRNRVASVNNLSGFSNKNFIEAYKEEITISFHNLPFFQFIVAFCIKTTVLLYVAFLNYFKKLGLYKYLIRVKYAFFRA